MKQPSKTHLNAFFGLYRWRDIQTFWSDRHLSAYAKRIEDRTDDEKFIFVIAKLRRVFPQLKKADDLAIDNIFEKALNKYLIDIL